MKIFANTDVGKARNMNQDCYNVIQKEDLTLCILADGMGGYNGGDIASKLATISAQNYILDNFYKIEDKSKKNILELIKNATEYENMIVYDEANKTEELDQMGTTLEICLIYNDRAYIGHIGDSRIYRIRKGLINKLTIDHSYVQKLVKDGTITREEAKNHPKKNMLIKALGSTAFAEPDITVRNFYKDDVILICSDGLTNMVSEEEILKIIEEDLEKATINLVNRANDLGGLDNITLIIVKND